MKMAPITAMSAPGILPVISLRPRIVTSTPAETATVVQLIWSSVPNVEISLPIVLVKWSADGDAGAIGDAEHAAHLAACHLDPDAGQEPDQHRPGQEVGQESEADEAGDDQEHAGHQGQQPGERDVLGRPGDREPARPAAITAAVAESAPTTR